MARASGDGAERIAGLRRGVRECDENDVPTMIILSSDDIPIGMWLRPLVFWDGVTNDISVVGTPMHGAHRDRAEQSAEQAGEEGEGRLQSTS